MATIYGTTASDTITGNAASDSILAGNGNDIVFALGGDDLLYGWDGDDYLFGEDGNDALFGEDGNDVLFGGDSNDYFNGGNGNDALVGEDGNDTLIGGNANDILYAGDGNDDLYGGDGDDFLFGYNYANESGTEYDTLNGGVGADGFVLGDPLSGVSYLGSGYAIIIDFDRLEGDKLYVSGTTGYSLSYLDFGVGTSSLDTGIFYNSDLIGIAQDTTSVLYPTDFISI